jgi:hypothetical protein
VLEEPPPTPPAVGKPKKKRGKDSDKWAAAEAAALAASMAAATVVRIKALDGLGVNTLCHQVGDGASVSEVGGGERKAVRLMLRGVVYSCSSRFKPQLMLPRFWTRPWNMYAGAHPMLRSRAACMYM